MERNAATSDRGGFLLGSHGGGVVRVIRPGLVINGGISGSFTLDYLTVGACRLLGSWLFTLHIHRLAADFQVQASP